MPPPEAFQIALQHHQAGRLADAEVLYRQILAAQPNHADALHLLGLIAHQVGRHDLAVESIRRALVLNPNNPAAHCNLGEACRALGGLDQALAAYRQALNLKPDYPEALNNLGNALRERRQYDEALAAYRRALILKPDFPEAENNLGAALAEQSQFDEAIAAYRRALQLRPDYPEALNNLGNALKDLAQFDEAIAACRRALELKPDYPAAHNSLGVALRERGQLDKAIAACRRALELQPDYPEARNNLGSALMDRGQFDEAMSAYRRALDLKPDYPEALNNLGVALRERGQLDEAVAACRRALELKPDNPEGLTNLGNALSEQGQLDEALASYRRALRIKPRDARAHSNLILTLHYHSPHAGAEISAEQQRWNRQFSEPLKQTILPHANDPSVSRPLRIGYVSPDFRDHVVGRNLLPLFLRHDRQHYKILCYSGVAQPDRLTAIFRDHAQEWRSTVGVSDEALAARIRQDGVDILVDLSQHTAGNRLPLFARQPAPVQVSFAGYPESAGVEAIEYRISDRHLEPEPADEAAGRKEQIHLIDSFWCYDPCGVEMEVNELPARESGRVTFGCLNNFCKVNEPALKLWAQVLGKVTDSRLVLLSGLGTHRQRTLQAFEREGVEADRVRFVEYRPRREYLELYHGLDIALDTSPYNGHTTSLDALWMGVPVVSLAGNTPVSRGGLSQLTNLGLPELVAHSEAEFVTIAVNLARDLPRLAHLRSTLRNRMEKSVLMDAPRFARNIEASYQKMWQHWRASGSSLRKD